MKKSARNKLVPSDNLKIVIIRHGEKPATGDNLSPQGLNRALQLPTVLYKKFGKPDYTYVPALKCSTSTSHARMFQTVTPFAVQYGLTVNSAFAEDGYAQIKQDVLSKIGTVLMVWEHSAIQQLAIAFGYPNAPKWKGKDFDSIWIITFKNGTASLAYDQEGITP